VSDANQLSEHTLLVTEDGVEILTARLPDSPGGPISMPVADGEKMENGEKNTEAAA
jgi:methionyl aminopeptidase